MIVKVTEHTKSNDIHKIKFRLEQEFEPYNSFNPTVSVSEFDVVDYTENEVFSLAFERIKNKYVDKFKSINDVLGFEHEEINYEFDFSLRPVKEIAVEEPKRVVSDQEKINDMVNYLMQNDEFLKMVGIETRKETIVV